MIVVSLATFGLILITYFLIGVVVVAWGLFARGFEIRKLNDLIELVLIVCACCVIWPVLAYVWAFDKEDKR